MTSQKILKLYIDFFISKSHKQIPNVSLIPKEDSTLLFVNSGMFPLAPYLSGETHPLGKRLVNVQRALRFEDLEEVGDNRHTTAFHMLGNWSLGDYFKQQQLFWIYEYYIEKLGLDPKRIFATVFKGDKHAPKDKESVDILKSVFNKYGIDARENARIFLYGREDNWWQRGDTPGELGGPDSEIFYYLGTGTGEGKDPSKHQHEFLEIGNSVFMQYIKTKKGWDELPQKNVDFGGGLERIALVVQKKTDIFETDNFAPIIALLQEKAGKKYGRDKKTTSSMRIIADHIRAAVLLAMDGVVPSNKDQGYVLRRYIRRMVRFARRLNIYKNITLLLIPAVINTLSWLYPSLPSIKENISSIFIDEEEKFQKTLKRAMPIVEKQLKNIPNKSKESMLAARAFDLYQSYGYPPEFFIEEIIEKKITINKSKFKKAYKERKNIHQKLSQKGAQQKFKGGLADHSKEVIKYHTATHLVHEALRRVLGSQVSQRGSNITKSRLRFDFTHQKPLTQQEIKKIEKLVNTAIKQKLPVNFVILPRKKAEKTGALHFFNETYGEKVKIYYIGESLEKAFSKEFCGGPHVASLSELSPTLFIYKQESVGKGIRRLYARFNK